MSGRKITVKGVSIRCGNWKWQHNTCEKTLLVGAKVLTKRCCFKSRARQNLFDRYLATVTKLCVVWSILLIVVVLSL